MNLMFRVPESEKESEVFMDLFKAIKERRSCREFIDEPVDEKVVSKILEAGCWAPSPLNSQPWEFLIITSQTLKEKIYLESERHKAWAMEKSGWKWLGPYRVDFLKSVPVIIAVIGDAGKSGVDMFQKEGPTAYQHACAASVQNMLLAAHALKLGGLWFTLFDKIKLGIILDVAERKIPLALLCIGKPAMNPVPAPRRDILKKIRFIR